MFEIGPISVYSWGVMVAIGFLVGLFLARREAIRAKISPDAITDLAIYLLIAGIIFGRFVYIIFDLSYFKENPLRIFMIQEGGLAIHGSLLGGVLVGYWFSRRHKISFGKLADIIAPSLVLGQTIGRIGCFLNGDSYGKITTLPWGVQFIGFSEKRHPTQIYEAVLNLIVFIIIWKWKDRKKFEGHLFLIYLILYSIVRSIVEIFRSSEYILKPLTYAQGASVLIIIVSCLLIKFYKKDLLVERKKLRLTEK
ncbi:MAG: prolipoprotein diacylglyceryl transferase [Actinobacteria bacterium]|nr:prolipoprotein diacylglyceryl transferase [Actinomycetota bacterium]